MGQHSAAIRAATCEPLAFLGVRIDPARNLEVSGDAAIGAPGRVSVLVVSAREELELAAEARRLLDAT